MRPVESKVNKVVESMALIGIAVPVVGVFLGGIYSVPAIRLSRGREPWLSVLMSLGLAITAFGIGYLSHTRILFSGGVWGFSLLLLLLVRRVHGPLDGNLERFGLVHAFTLLATFVLAAITEHGVPKIA